MINEVMLPLDMWKEVVKYTQSNFENLSLVSKQFEFLAKDYAKLNEPYGCFGVKDWNNYGGKTEAFFPVPWKMFLKFDPLKYLLTFIPETINENPITLSSVDRFVSDYKNGKEVFKSNLGKCLKQADIDDSTPMKFKAHWIMLSKEIIDGGEEEDIFEIIEQLVEEKKFEIPYLIDTVVSLFMHNLKTEEFVYSNGMTIIQEKAKRGDIVLGFYSSDNGLCLTNTRYCDSSIFSTLGTACAKQAFEES